MLLLEDDQLCCVIEEEDNEITLKPKKPIATEKTTVVPSDAKTSLRNRSKGAE